MKKTLSLILALMLLLLCLVGCDSLKHEHITGDWEYNESGHWQPITCNLNTCNLGEIPILEHIDDNDDNMCDVCGYTQTSDTNLPTDSNTKSKSKLIDLEQYSSMTSTGTTSIEVVYDYIEGDFTTYEFVIEDQEVIEKIMTEVFNMELEDYPEDRDFDMYQRWIVVKQGETKYHIDLTLASDGEKQYICKSQEVRDIIKKYIEDNLIEQNDKPLALPNHCWTEETTDGKTTFACTRCSESYTCISEIREFSYAQALEYYKIGDPGVKHENFNNPAVESEITSAIDAIIRAELELTIEYDTISASYDEVSNMWRVDFWTLDLDGNSQSVYVNGNGLTCYIAYGE